MKTTSFAGLLAVAATFLIGHCQHAHAQTAPANDSFTNSTILSGSRILLTNDNTFATQEPHEPANPACRTGKTLWYSYRAPEKGLLRVAASELVSRTGAATAIYEGDSLATLTLLGANCYETPTYISTVSNRTYRIALDGKYSSWGELVMAVDFDAVPPNDAFTNSIHLEGSNVAVIANNVAASIEPGEPLQTSDTASIWYSWAAPFTGRARVGGIGSVGRWWIYTGDRVDQLTLQRMVPDFLAEEGKIYQIQVNTTLGAYPLTLAVTPFPPAPNDHFTNAAGLSGIGPYTGDSRSIGDATLEPGEPIHRDGAPSKSLWWHWQAPLTCYATFWGIYGVAPDPVFDIYVGDSLRGLTRIATGTNKASTPVVAGTSYYISASVASNASGDVSFYIGSAFPSYSSYGVPGNILQEPSFEGTGGSFQYWEASPGYEPHVNQGGGADGSTWIILRPGGTLAQNLPTVPGHDYKLGFAFRNGSDMRIQWDDQVLGSVTGHGFWKWTNFTVTATQSVSRLKFTNVGAQTEVDAGFVVSASEPPVIIAQPVSASVTAGGAVAFDVSVSGSPPFYYHWRSNGVTFAVGNSATLLLEDITSEMAGTYSVLVSNKIGTAISSPATLVVEAATAPAIVLQPEGQIIPAGAYHVLSAAAIGTPPLTYQWIKDGTVLADATNSRIVFTALAAADEGEYSLQVSNHVGTVRTLSARLSVTNSALGQGVVQFQTLIASGNTTIQVPIFDIDGVTKLTGTGFLAQLYAGSSIETMRPVGQPVGFRTGFLAGLVAGGLVTVPTVPANLPAVMQVRAWQASKGASYEEARALGGKFGKSNTVTVAPKESPWPPPSLLGLESFHLRAGLPQFVTGIVSIERRRFQDQVLMTLRGEADSAYLIERSTNRFDWHPLKVVTNVTGTVSFEDSPAPIGRVLYRARILD